ncbi:MAG: hypothetical protein H0U57_05600 [Tatlockia sp.]|nr:hypothetical protein [Tatlockia sp.]
MTFQIKQGEFPSIENLYQEIDNPGHGDCGFYAFAIGFISLIQTEIFKGNRNPEQLEILNKLTIKSEKYDPKQFSDFDYFLHNEDDKHLLEKLKSDLRGILYNQYLHEICQGSVIIEGENSIRKSLAYMQFSEIFYHYHHGANLYKSLNILYMSEEIRHFALMQANKYKHIEDPNKLELQLQSIFMTDVFGKNYLSQTQISWKSSSRIYNDYLSKGEEEIILLFKQFKMVVLDLYNKAFTTLKLDPDYKLKNESVKCAHSIRKHKESLHQRVKLIVDKNPLDLQTLEEGTLYIQLVDFKNKLVRVYSTALDKSYDYTTVKAENLINSIRHKCPSFKFKSGFSLLIDKSESTLFHDISSTADDTLNENYFFKTIITDFLEGYSTNTFAKPIAELDLSQQLEIERIKILTNSKCTIPLTFEQKHELTKKKMVKLRDEILDSSVIISGLTQIKKDKEWLATDQDLNYLSELFKVHLTILENGERTIRSSGPNTYRRPTFAIDNLSNNHWITRLQYGYQAGNSASKYANWCCVNLPLSKNEIKKTLQSYTTGFVSLFGRTHKAKAEVLITKCDSDEFDVADIIGDLRQYMSEVKYDSNSSFRKRFEYLDSRYRNFENDIFNKRDIERIFGDYVTTGFCRNHLYKARQILADCKDPEKSIDQIVTSIESYVNTHQFNKNSHFLERFKKISQLKSLHEEAQEEAEVENRNVI